MPTPDSAAGASASAAARSVAMPTDCSPRVTLVATAPRPCGKPAADTPQVGCQIMEGHLAVVCTLSMCSLRMPSYGQQLPVEFVRMTQRHCADCKLHAGLATTDRWQAYIASGRSHVTQAAAQRPGANPNAEPRRCAVEDTPAVARVPHVGWTDRPSWAAARWYLPVFRLPQGVAARHYFL